MDSTISQVLLGYSQIDEYIQDNVDLIPVGYLKFKLIYSKQFDDLIEGNNWLPKNERLCLIMKNPEDAEDQYIISNTIPRKFIEATNLPTGESLRKDILDFDVRKLRNGTRKFRFKTQAERLLNAYLFQWTFFTPHYNLLTSRADLIQFLSRKHALLLEVLAMSKEEGGPTLNYLHLIYNEIGRLYFKELSLGWFYEITALIAKAPEMAHLVIAHGSLGQHKENIKFTPQAKLIAIDERFDRNKKMPEIHRTVNAYLRSQRGDTKGDITLATLQRFLNIPSVKNFIYIRRYQGDIDTRNYLLPYLTRKRCLRSNMQIQIDTFDIPISTLPFLIGFLEKSRVKFDADEILDKTDKKKKFGHRVKCCIVVDNHSGLPIGFSCDFSENRWMQLNALRMALLNTGTIPFELLSDNHSGYSTPEWIKVIKLLELFGCRYRQERVNHPQDKVIVEMTIRSLHAIFREYSGYTGHGIRSRKKDSHVSKDYKKLIFQKIHIRDIDGVKALIPEVMTKFANHSFNGKPTPRELYERSESLEGREIKGWQIAKMFFEETEVPVSNSSFKFVLKGTTYIYHLATTREALDINGTRAICRYNPLDLETAFLFDKSTDQFLCEVNRFHEPATLPEEMTEEDTKILTGHFGRSTKIESDMEELFEEHQQEMKLLNEAKLILEDNRTDKRAFSDQALEHYIDSNKLYEKPPKEIVPINVTHMDVVRRRKKESDLDLHAAPIEVLEEMEID